MKTYALIVAAAVALSACGDTKPSRFYVLAPVVEPDGATREMVRTRAFGVGPVELPSYLDRPQLVSFTTANKVDISEFDRWAEPIEDNFTRVLGENLAALMPEARIETYPFSSTAPNALERQVVVQVSQFRLNAARQVEIKANWTVLEPGRRRGVARSFATLVPVEDQGTEAVVAAMSRAVGGLSRDIRSGLGGTFAANEAGR
jgi:uncharacterized lipoprotein YmbA